LSSLCQRTLVFASQSPLENGDGDGGDGDWKQSSASVNLKRGATGVRPMLGRSKSYRHHDPPAPLPSTPCYSMTGTFWRGSKSVRCPFIQSLFFQGLDSSGCIHDRDTYMSTNCSRLYLSLHVVSTSLYTSRVRHDCIRSGPNQNSMQPGTSSEVMLASHEWH
jgi:hypothetical protein